MATNILDMIGGSFRDPSAGIIDLGMVLQGRTSDRRLSPKTVTPDDISSLDDVRIQAAQGMWADGSEPVGGLLDSFGFLSSTPVDHSSACCISCLHLDVGTDAAFLAAGFPRNSMSNGTALQQRAFHRVQARRELDTEMDPRMKRPVAVRCLPRRRSSPRSATAGSARSHGVTLPGRSHNCANDRSSIARAELNTLPIRGQGQNRSIFHA